jgi:4-diphosphocytidyl-2-C-methyl-D-erythritol kinase
MISLKSPAKINLFLRILGKAQNGYHYIDSLFMRLDELYDMIDIEPSDTSLICINGILDEQNILHKCLNLLNEKYGFTKCFKINIIKNIPIGGGLGGGSSNAGVFLNFIRQNYNISLTTEDLLKIGADVAFFYRGYKSAVCTRFGEVVVEVDLPALHSNILLINPNIHVPTAQIFENYKHARSTSCEVQNPQTYFNSLEPITSNLYPQVRQVLDYLKNLQTAQFSAMSGSGASCFGFYEHCDLEQITSVARLNNWNLWSIKLAQAAVN